MALDCSNSQPLHLQAILSCRKPRLLPHLQSLLPESLSAQGWEALSSVLHPAPGVLNTVGIVGGREMGISH